MKLNELLTIDFLKDLNEHKLSQLEDYMFFTLQENEKFNLTAHKEIDSFIIKNILDSLLLVKFIDFDISNKTVIDIGSGAGLPGIPLAIYYTNTKFYLLEPIKKRANFLKQVKQKLNLENVTVINGRAEEIFKENDLRFDFATARAVANLSILLELTIPLLKVGGIFMCYKGSNYENELTSSFSALNKLFSSTLLVDNCVLPFSKELRSFIFFKKDKETPNTYPRSYSLIKKKPL